MKEIILFATNSSKGMYKLFNSKEKRNFYEQHSNNKCISMGRASGKHCRITSEKSTEMHRVRNRNDNYVRPYWSLHSRCHSTIKPIKSVCSVNFLLWLSNCIFLSWNLCVWSGSKQCGPMPGQKINILWWVLKGKNCSLRASFRRSMLL